MALIVPGILTNDEDEYSRRLSMAELVCNLIQIDVVDGIFSQNKTIGVDIIRKYPCAVRLEIQLMVEYPKNYIDELVSLDYVSRIIFPFEINTNLHEVIYSIKKHNKQAGLSLNPETPVSAAGHLFDELDLLLLMTGKPGYSGQKLGDNTYIKIADAKRHAKNLDLEIDIGVNLENAQKLAEAGADFLVASSALYNAPNFSVAFSELASAARLES